MNILSDKEILEKCSNFTITSVERQINVIRSIEHIINNNIDGDIIEIGVFKGGIIMIMLYKLMQLGYTNKKVHLYDTFSGMTESSEKDINPQGILADWNNPGIKCYASYEDVYRNVTSTGYPLENIIFHIGDIRNVKYTDIPSSISLLRLDNDWYELYKFELPIFEPLVIKNGVVIIDDYGFWSGCKEAIDDYINNVNYTPNIIKIDDCGIYWFKV